MSIVHVKYVGEEMARIINKRINGGSFGAAEESLTALAEYANANNVPFCAEAASLTVNAVEFNSWRSSSSDC